MNLHYIKAAIEAATGRTLTIDEVKAYLLSEGLASEDKLNRYTFRGYGQYFGDVSTGNTVNLRKLSEDIDIEFKGRTIDG